MENFFDFEVNCGGGVKKLSEYKNKVCLVVNVASKCGFTPQYEGLETLYKKYKDKGFVVLGFPCNQFGAQEPGSNEEIQEFCSLTFNTTFPIFSKIDVNGESADPLFKYLKVKAPGLLGTEAIKWNFTKFLVSKDGHTIKRYAPNTEPIEIEKDIAEALR